jgi:hypothetical protein
VNSEQALMIIAALDAATRAGFTVLVSPARTPGHVVAKVGRAFILAGKASDRVEPFETVGRTAQEALGNALAILTIEIGRDLRDAVERAAADEAAMADEGPRMNSERDLRPLEAR